MIRLVTISENTIEPPVNESRGPSPESRSRALRSSLLDYVPQGPVLRGIPTPTAEPLMLFMRPGTKGDYSSHWPGHVEDAYWPGYYSSQQRDSSMAGTPYVTPPPPYRHGSGPPNYASPSPPLGFITHDQGSSRRSEDMVPRSLHPEPTMLRPAEDRRRPNHDSIFERNRVDYEEHSAWPPQASPRSSHFQQLERSRSYPPGLFEWW